MRTIRLLVSIIFLITLCAVVSAPAASVDEILKAPLGSGGLRLGMNKTQVSNRYGEPDIKTYVTSTDWKEPREQWYYKGRFDILPINAGYLSDDLYLYFDGDSLTNISHEPIGASTDKEDESVDGVIR